MPPIQDPQFAAEASARLRTLIPLARANAETGDYVGHSGSSLFGAVMPYLTEANMLGLFVYPAKLGGWHADLVLKQVPDGVSNTLGSPTGQPLRTKAEAEAYALHMLSAVFTMIRQIEQGKVKPAPPSFKFGPLSVVLKQEMFEFFRHSPENLPASLRQARDPDSIGRIIDGMVAVFFPYGITQAAMMRLSHSEKLAMQSVLHWAALNNVLAYPIRRDGTPSGHADTPSNASRH